MENLVDPFVHAVSTAIEGLAAVVVGYGAIVAFYRFVIQSPRRRMVPGYYERARIDLGRKLVVGLELELGADILETAIAPTWNHIGIVGAIIVLRTVLNFVLEHEIEHLQERLGETITERA